MQPPATTNISKLQTRLSSNTSFSQHHWKIKSTNSPRCLISGIHQNLNRSLQSTALNTEYARSSSTFLEQSARGIRVLSSSGCTALSTEMNSYARANSVKSALFCRAMSTFVCLGAVCGEFEYFMFSYFCLSRLCSMCYLNTSATTHRLECLFHSIRQLAC